MFTTINMQAGKLPLWKSFFILCLEVEDSLLSLQETGTVVNMDICLLDKLLWNNSVICCRANNIALPTSPFILKRRGY